jgi:metallophosphoesterase superfamily enzyme
MIDVRSEAEAFGAMARQRVSDLVTHDHSDSVIVLGDGHHPFPKSNLASGKRKSVYFFSLNEDKLPFVFWLVCGSGNALSDRRSCACQSALVERRFFFKVSW